MTWTFNVMMTSASGTCKHWTNMTWASLQTRTRELLWEPLILINPRVGATWCSLIFLVTTDQHNRPWSVSPSDRDQTSLQLGQEGRSFSRFLIMKKIATTSWHLIIGLLIFTHEATCLPCNWPDTCCSLDVNLAKVWGNIVSQLRMWRWINNYKFQCHTILIPFESHPHP